MAERLVFIPAYQKYHLVEEVTIIFKWHSGFTPIQKRKNIAVLHEAASKKGYSPLLEVSSKSEDKLGRQLSAFNLKIKTNLGLISVESAFQGSKVFEFGGPYTDLYTKSSWEAKKDRRLKESGRLIGFDFMGSKWELVPKTAFYDWLYITALYPHREYLEKNLFKYKGFTDIEFNHKKSINCQARTCALLVSLMKLNLLDYAISSQKTFIEILSSSFS